MTDTFPMESAPKDRRILIKRHVLVFNGYGNNYKRSGTQWIECYYYEGKWQEWCGTQWLHSTDYIDPIEWTYLPGEGANDSYQLFST